MAGGIDIRGGATLIVGGLVVFLIFALLSPLYLSFWGTVPVTNMTTIGTTAWAYIPDFVGIGGMLLGFGILIVGVLRAIGLKVF